jgi:hypothetical protein
MSYQLSVDGASTIGWSRSARNMTQMSVERGTGEPHHEALEASGMRHSQRRVDSESCHVPILGMWIRVFTQHSAHGRTSSFFKSRDVRTAPLPGLVLSLRAALAQRGLPPRSTFKRSGPADSAPRHRAVFAMSPPSVAASLSELQNS